MRRTASAARGACAILWLLLSGCAKPSGEASIRLALRSGPVRLPPGVTEIHSEIALPEGAAGIEISGADSTLRAAADFRGRAIFSCKSCAGVRFQGFAIDGARDSIEQRAGLPDSNTPFSRFTVNNGILIEGGADLTISGVRFERVAGFAVLASGSRRVRVERARIAHSGSRSAAGRNNTTGGILIEEGSTDFEIVDCEFENIRGNGVWTHSLYTSPRNAGGRIANNRFAAIGRDAIQIGHASGVRVERNTGERIGYPESEVDVENKAIPVAIDTAGNTDRSVYSGNWFSKINGKCIDLDGFHHGEVTDNICLDLRNFGIVMNNTNPDMQSEAITISGNTIDGASYGGIFVIGAGNRVLRNTLRNLNRSRSVSPDLLRTGIYLGKGAERPAEARGNVIEGNSISGFNLECVGNHPAVSRAKNTIRSNLCSTSVIK